MYTRRMAVAALMALTTSALTIGSVAAAKPVSPTPQHPPAGERPLTGEEEAASARRVADALAYLAGVEASGANLVSLSCVTPQPSTSSVTPDACYVPAGYLGVEARDQVAGHYCGPAVGQVIANYSWAMASGANKYTQVKIAGWMKTDLNGLTNAPELEDGLEAATAGSPRRPAGWDWVVTRLEDSDADGALGDQLQGFVRSNISGSKMPLAIPVKPYDKNAQYHLSSWAKPVSSPGHWIAAYGWYSYWTGTDFARIYYTDSSKDEGGSTGKFWDPTRHIAEMIRVHTGRFVW
jgi:hypothetical protein